MLTIQEIFTKDIIKETMVDVKRKMESSASKGAFDYYEANIFGTGIEQKNPLEPSKMAELRETLKNVSLQQLCEKAGYVKEFLAKSGTSGLMGAAYLIPDKVLQLMMTSAVETDICAQVSRMMLGPDQITSASVKIDVAIDESYKPKRFSAGGKMPEEEINTVQCTLTPISWGINLNIANDLIEDAQFDVVQLHLEEAGREMGEFATNEALTILGTAPDGDGTLNSSATGDADATKYTGGTTSDIRRAIQGVTEDGYRPDTIVLCDNTFLDQIIYTVGVAYNEGQEMDRFFTGGFPTRIGPCNALYTNCDYITNSKGFTNNISLVFSKNYALVTGRKRWMRIEKYSEPVMDLIGATVSARQDSVTLYKDSIFTLTET